jgi:hypothetical protein
MVSMSGGVATGILGPVVLVLLCGAMGEPWGESWN